MSIQQEGVIPLEFKNTKGALRYSKNPVGDKILLSLTLDDDSNVSDDDFHEFFRNLLRNGYEIDATTVEQHIKAWNISEEQAINDALVDEYQIYEYRAYEQQRAKARVKARAKAREIARAKALQNEIQLSKEATEEATDESYDLRDEFYEEDSSDETGKEIHPRGVSYNFTSSEFPDIASILEVIDGNLTCTVDINEDSSTNEEVYLCEYYIGFNAMHWFIFDKKNNKIFELKTKGSISQFFLGWSKYELREAKPYDFFTGYHNKSFVFHKLIAQRKKDGSLEDFTKEFEEKFGLFYHVTTVNCQLAAALYLKYSYSGNKKYECKISRQSARDILWASERLVKMDYDAQTPHEEDVFSNITEDTQDIYVR